MSDSNGPRKNDWYIERLKGYYFEELQKMTDADGGSAPSKRLNDNLELLESIAEQARSGFLQTH